MFTGHSVVEPAGSHPPPPPNKKATAGVAFLFGGGGGNRTRVRKPSTVRTTCLAWSFESRLAPANRQADAQPVASTDPHSQATRPCREADVNDTAPLAGPDPSAGQCSVSPVLGGERITLVVGVYRISRWIYEVTGPRHALCCFATRVETRSPPFTDRCRLRREFQWQAGPILSDCPSCPIRQKIEQFHRPVDVAIRSP